ncbi:unnamed protein product [Rhodiola kirilowii]
MTTVRILLAIATAKRWPLYQLDVNNAFLHGDLEEEVYMSLPPGFFNEAKLNGKVCKLKKSLYGLKQASRQWFSKFSEALIGYGFVQSQNDHSLFTLTNSDEFIALLVYVDDVVLTGTNLELISAVKSFIHSRFKIKDLGHLKFFLGLEVARSDSGLLLNQRKYVLDLLADTGLLGCKPSLLPMDTSHKLALSTSPILDDPIPYRRLVGQLIYLCITRPDICYSVHILSQFLAHPRLDHLSAAHKVLKYLKGAPAQGLFYSCDSSLGLSAYSDMDWAACPLTRKSISGYAILLGNSLISWKSKKQSLVSRSSAEAEYRAMAHTCCELVWVHRLLQDFQISTPTPIPMFCDNVAAMHITRNPVFHERTKHVEIDCHTVRHHFATSFISPQFVPSLEQAADLLTKALASDHLLRLSSKLHVSNALHTSSLRGGVESARIVQCD